MPKHLAAIVLAIAAGLLPTRAHAGIPVIDVTAVANLIQQISYWQQQISAMASQLNQLQQTYGAMTGGRGMEGLLNMTNLQRNYLPQDYTELMNVVNGSSVTYAGLSAQVQAAVSANAVLSSSQLATMTPEMRKIVEDGRRAAAMVSTLSQSAYQNTSQRFSALQSLINAIGTAGDTKAIQDLQGRLAAEQAMLTNEQTKLQMLAQVVSAEQLNQAQRRREQAIRGIGDVDVLPAVRY